MRAEHDPLKGCLNYPHLGTDNLLMLNGHSSRFPIDNGLLDDGHSDQVGVLNSPTCYPAHQNGERIEHFSRKVFVGGLPPDIDEDEITASFRRFGPLVVDWPHKAESKSYFPPKELSSRRRVLASAVRPPAELSEARESCRSAPLSQGSRRLPRRSGSQQRLRNEIKPQVSHFRLRRVEIKDTTNNKLPLRAPQGWEGLAEIQAAANFGAATILRASQSPQS
ncbi:RRM domain-containing protein [Crotalus adamanteus]|uniref:RRM domain-containing protein n=1 Tax=Crotalus adamanteus TaxID=8729 RepID=A0AAW1BAS2_CROAD